MEDFYSEANKKYIKGFTNTTLRFLSFSACSFPSLGLPEMFVLSLHQILILLPILACHQRPFCQCRLRWVCLLLKSGCAPLAGRQHCAYNHPPLHWSWWSRAVVATTALSSEMQWVQTVAQAQQAIMSSSPETRSKGGPFLHSLPKGSSSYLRALNTWTKVSTCSKMTSIPKHSCPSWVASKESFSRNSVLSFP